MSVNGSRAMPGALDDVLEVYPEEYGESPRGSTQGDDDDGAVGTRPTHVRVPSREFLQPQQVMRTSPMAAQQQAELTQGGVSPTRHSQARHAAELHQDQHQEQHQHHQEQRRSQHSQQQSGGEVSRSHGQRPLDVQASGSVAATAGALPAAAEVSAVTAAEGKPRVSQSRQLGSNGPHRNSGASLPIHRPTSWVRGDSDGGAGVPTTVLSGDSEVTK